MSFTSVELHFSIAEVAVHTGRYCRLDAVGQVVSIHQLALGILLTLAQARAAMTPD